MQKNIKKKKYQYKYNKNKSKKINQKEEKTFFFFGKVFNNSTKTPKLNYLYVYKPKRRKKKKGIFLKTPFFNEIRYPYNFNFKLIKEMLKK